MTVEPNAGTDVLRAAVRIAADTARYTPPSSKLHDRVMVRRSLVDRLRRALDDAGYGDDWRTLHRVIRTEENQQRHPIGKAVR